VLHHLVKVPRSPSFNRSKLNCPHLHSYRFTAQNDFSRRRLQALCSSSSAGQRAKFPNQRKHMTTSAVAPETTVPAVSLDHILQPGLAFWASKTLLSAVEMEVFTELARGPETLQALTGRLGLHPRSSRDFLDALVALGFLERENGQYRNTP